MASAETHTAKGSQYSLLNSMRDESRFLAKGRYGEIKRCFAGCTHLTFASASLHFESFDEFLHLADGVIDQHLHPKPQDVVDVTYRWITLRLTRQSFDEMVKLVRSAVEEAAWWDGDLTSDDLDQTAGFPKFLV